MNFALFAPVLRSRWVPREAAAATRSELRPSTIAMVLIGAVFFIAYSLSYPRSLDERPAFNSPRNNVGWTLGERFADGHGFDLPLRHFEELPPDMALALTPRDAAQIDGHVVPKDFAGGLLLHGGLIALWPALALFVAPTFAILAAWAIARLAEELFDQFVALAAFAGFLAAPAVWINASDVFAGDTAALCFWVLSMLYFTRYWRSARASELALASAAMSVSILFRYPNVLIATPLVVALIAGRRFDAKHASLAGAAGIPACATILIFNAAVYGGPFTTGFHLGADLMASTVNYSQESFFKVRPDVLWRYVQSYTVGAPLVALPLLIGAAAAAWIARVANGVQRMVALVSLGTTAILIAYYGQQDAWGYRSPMVNASILRYLLPAFAIAYIFVAAAAVHAARRWGPAVSLVPASLCIAAAAYAFTGPNGVFDQYRVQGRTNDVRREVIQATEPDAIVASRILDKVLFPWRQTMTLTYMARNENPVAKEGETWDAVPTPERFADVAIAVNARGIPFYIIGDGRTGRLDGYRRALEARGHTFRRIQDVPSVSLYKIVRIDETSR